MYLFSGASASDNPVDDPSEVPSLTHSKHDLNSGTGCLNVIVLLRCKWLLRIFQDKNLHALSEV